MRWCERILTIDSKRIHFSILFLEPLATPLLTVDTSGNIPGQVLNVAALPTGGALLMNRTGGLYNVIRVDNNGTVQPPIIYRYCLLIVVVYQPQL